MKKIYTIALLLLGTSSVFAQLSRELDAFRQLDVTDKINVKIVPSTIDKIIIEGELANQMELTQVNDELRLKMTGSYVLQGEKVFATLYSTKVSSIIARKGAQVNNADSILKLDSIYLSANEGANIDLVIQATEVKAWATTGGTINLAGTGNLQNINVALGGGYLAKDLVTQEAVARVSAGGKIQINVSKRIDVQTRAGGIVDVYGNPKDRKQRKLAGGKINYL